MEKNLKITNFNQFETLVKYMEDNPSFARGFNKGVHKIDVKQKWNSLALTLNSIGPPTRDGAGWQKVWIDLKGKVKKKIVHNKREVNATGGGVFNQQSLSPLETRVANVMCFNEMLNPIGKALGTSNIVPTNASTSSGTKPSAPPNPISTPSPEEMMLMDLLSDEEIAENVAGSNSLLESAKKTQVKIQKELLVDQIDIQRSFYNEVRLSFKNIEEHMKDSKEFQHKLLHLEEEKLKLAKD
ncbi:PREDICTED: uncharacterized protein LOC108361987, partial [Rhagoletis zephyria]|uniref:uncharacterized protein LOC108361987 n=1 Tax=Rhagoletis zephyria TaxID=28612 RepID=UPI000811A3A2